MVVAVLLIWFLFLLGCKTEGKRFKRSCGLHCDSGECIEKHGWCNSNHNCDDGSDEKYCQLLNRYPQIECDESMHFQCKTNDMCIPLDGYCDGFSSCPDMSDENNCPCTEIYEDEGNLLFEAYLGSYQTHQKCWKFLVNDNQYLHLQIVANLYPRDCKYGNVTVYTQSKKRNRQQFGYFDSLPQYPYEKSDVHQYEINNLHQICESRYRVLYEYPNPVIHNETYTFFNDTMIRYSSNFYRSERDDDLKDFLTITYKKVNKMCDKPEGFICSSNSCISPEKRCDGRKDCSNGKDEENCYHNYFSAENLLSYRNKAIKWLRKQHDADWGWKEDTQRAVVALYLAGNTTFDSSNKEDDLVAKQLELEVFTHLYSRQFDKPSSTELAAYISALLVICHDPRNFYGRNLIALLREELHLFSGNSPPFIYLTLCNAKEPISEDEVNFLLQTVNDSSLNHGFFLELQALSILALSCIANNDRANSIRENISQAITNLKKEQMEDGSFGNEYTTALVLQALIANNQGNVTDWNPESAAKFLKSKQKEDGSFGDILTTYFALPLLNQKSLVDVGKVNCTEGLQRPRESDIASDIKNKLGKKSVVKYSLFIGDEKDQVHPILLRAPENITVFELMTIAADIDPKYKFKVHEIRKKMYIYEISSIPNDPEINKFWFIFQGSDNGTIFIPEQSPDKVQVHEKDHIIMWYKTFKMQ